MRGDPHHPHAPRSHRSRRSARAVRDGSSLRQPWRGVHPFCARDGPGIRAGADRGVRGGRAPGRRGAPASSRGSRSTCCPCRVTLPPRVAFRITAPDGDEAVFVGDVIFAGSVGRTDFPGSSWPVLEQSILGLYDARRARRADPPGPRALDDARAGARHEPVPRRRPSPLSDALPVAPRHARLAARPDARAPARGRARARDLRARRLPRGRDAGVRGHRACSCAPAARAPRSCRRRCTPSRTRASGPISLRPELTAPLCARTCSTAWRTLPQPVTLLDRRRLLPLQRRAARAAARVPPVRRRGDRLRRPGRRRRAHRAAGRLVREPRHRRAGARAELHRRRPPTAGRTSRCCVEYLDRHLGELSDDVRRQRDTNPLRAFDTKDERSRAIMADAPKITDHLSAGAREHFEAVRALLDARGVGLPRRADARARARLLHAHRVGVQVAAARRPVDHRRRRALRRAGRGHRRAADARRRASAPGWSGCCWRSARPPEADDARRRRLLRDPAPAGAAAAAGAARRGAGARPARRGGPGRAAARRASSGRPTGCGARLTVVVRRGRVGAGARRPSAT